MHEPIVRLKPLRVVAYLIAILLYFVTWGAVEVYARFTGGLTSGA